MLFNTAGSWMMITDGVERTDFSDKTEKTGNLITVELLPYRSFAGKLMLPDHVSPPEIRLENNFPRIS
jgi:hypothetical protein